MHQMQWQGHTEFPSPSLSNPTEATNAREENERKNKKENTKISKIYPRGSPHIEEKVIGGNVDLDLLSFSPQKLARIHGGIES